jgi:hypothetical protein
VLKTVETCRALCWILAEECKYMLCSTDDMWPRFSGAHGTWTFPRLDCLRPCEVLPLALLVIRVITGSMVKNHP